MNGSREFKYGRIIYSDHPGKPGMLRSNIIISARTGAEYEVHVDVPNMKYWVKNIGSQGLAPMPEEKKISNRNVLLRNIKKHLQKLGVVFYKELRNRSFGICDKGYTQKKHKQNNSIPNNGLE